MLKLEDLCVDPEFQNKIPPLTDAEFEQLRENILRERTVYVPLCVWNGVIVDGHHRYKILKEHPEISYKVREMSFPNKWAAFDWMYKNQLGRRNLTDEQRTVLIGKMYEARKKSHGGDRKSSRQTDDLTKKRTVDQIAEEIGVGTKTVERAEKFSKGIDVLTEVSKEAADKILAGGSGVKKQDVRNLLGASKEDVEAFAESVLSPKTVPEKAQVTAEENKPKRPGRPKEYRQLRKDIDEIEADMYSPPQEYTIEKLLREISENGAEWARMLVMTVNGRPELLTDENRKKIIMEINTIINEFKKIRRMIDAQES